MDTLRKILKLGKPAKKLTEVFCARTKRIFLTNDDQADLIARVNSNFKWTIVM